MKRLFGYILCLTFVSLFAGCDKKGVRFSIKCSGLVPKETYYLTPADDTGHYYLKDKAGADGSISFGGVIQRPVYANICNALGSKVATLFVEGGKIEIIADGPFLVAKGTPSNDAYNAYVAMSDSLMAKYLAIKETTPQTVAAYEHELDSLNDALWQNNTDKILGVYLFANEQINALSDEQLAQWLERFTPEMQQHPYMDAVREKLNFAKKIEEKE